jgi:beta-lactamase class A
MGGRIGNAAVGILGAALGLGAALLVGTWLRPRRAAPPAPAPARVTSTPRAGIDAAALQRLLEEEVRRIPGRVAVHLALEGGPEAGVRAEEPMPAASVIKLPLAAALLAAWRSGAVKRTPEDAARLQAMITRSDNPAADALIDGLGMAGVNRWLASNGYRATRLRRKMGVSPRRGDNVVSAAEMTRMLLEIERGTLVDRPASAELRALLLAQTRRTRIPAGLPEGAVAGNKTGSLRGIVNDVGFVERPGGPRYALAVLVSGAGSDSVTSQAIARLSRRVWDALAR